jgi:predicted small lipoprotein YifL
MTTSRLFLILLVVAAAFGGCGKKGGYMRVAASPAAATR